jgi:anti-sigma regulatory factor (Ser/Thr protein kinase)
VRRRLRLRSDTVSFPGLRGWAERACRGCVPGAAEARVLAVALAVHETVRNVAEHAYAHGGPGPIDVLAEGRGGRLVLSVVHDGAPFAREALPAPAFDGTRERGFGVFLAERAVDRISFSRTPGGRQVVRLEKWLAAAGDCPEEERWRMT